MHTMKVIEDFICDWVDETLQDGIETRKILDAGIIGARSASLMTGLQPVDDHSQLWRGSCRITEIAESRSKALNDIDLIRAAMPVYFRHDLLAIHLRWGYSMLPYKIMVGTVPAYLMTVNLKLNTN